MTIDASEFQKLVRDLGYTLSDEECALQVKLIATRGGKEIEFGEFKQWWSQHADKLEQWNPTELERLKYFASIFDEVDADHSGLIDSEAEFSALHASLVAKGFKLPELAQCRKEMDADHNLKISYDELVAYMRTMGAFDGEG